MVFGRMKEYWKAMKKTVFGTVVIVIAATQIGTAQSPINTACGSTSRGAKGFTCVDLIDSNNQLIAARATRTGTESNQVLLTFSDGFPNDTIQVWQVVPPGSGEGFLVVRITREYELEVSTHRQNKLSLFHNSGFYRRRKFRGPIPVNAITPGLHNLISYRNLISGRRNATQGLFTILDPLWWTQDLSRKVVPQSLSLEEPLRDFQLKYTGNAENKLFSVLLIHYHSNNQEQKIRIAKLTDGEGQRNDLDRIFVNVTSFREDMQTQYFQTFFDEAN